MENNQIVLNDEIFNKAKEGDRNALALLCKKSMQSAYFMALKILKNETDAEDITSECMITIIEKIHTLQDVKAYDGWVNRIVTNKCYDFIKKMKPVLCGDYGPEYIDNAELEEFNKEFIPEDFAVDKEKRKILMDVIKEETNEMEMMTIMMFYYNDESISTIAANMGCAEITVKKRLASARTKIKNGIEKKYGKGVAFMATGIIFVLSQAMKAEASEISVPVEAAANIMNAAGAAATKLQVVQTAQTMQNVQETQTAQTIQSVQETQTAQTIQNVQETQTAQTIQSAQSTQTAQSTQNMQTTQTAQSLQNVQTVNGGTEMSDMMKNTNNTNGAGINKSAATVTKSGLSGGAIAGICAGVVGLIAAIGIGIAVMFGGGDDNDNDVTPTTNIQASNDVTTNVDNDETSSKDEAGKETTTEEQTTEKSTTEETTTKKEYEEIPFEQYTVSDLGFVAKNVYTNYDDECIFIWSHTEDDILNWFRENHKANDTYSYKVSNLSGLGTFDEREVLVYTPRKVEDGKPYEASMEQNLARCIVQTKSYNKDVPSSVMFEFENKSQEEVIAEVSKFIEFMGFGEYKEQIIHNSYMIDIETENELGEYSITTNYSFNKIYGTYTLSVKFEYKDKKYEEANEEGIELTKIEKWDDYYKLSDYMTNTEFDNTNTETMAKAIGEYAVAIGMNGTLKYYGPDVLRFTYEYTSADETKIIKDAVCTYAFDGKESEDDENTLDGVQKVSFGIHYEEEKFSNIATYVYLTPVYNEDRDTESKLNDDDINNLTEKRMQILSKIDPAFEVTKDKMLEIYKSEKSYRIDNEDRTYSFTVYNEFKMLSYVLRATIW